MKKRFLPLLLALCLCLPLTLPGARAATYPDVERHWAAPAIHRWSESGVLKGYSDGRFAPDDPISRAQLAEILYRVWGCKPNLARSYSDVSPKAWYYQGVTTMANYGVVLTRSGQVRPEETLTREEAFYMLARAFGVGNDATGANIPKQVTDGADIAPGYRDRLTAMFNAKYLKGGSDGTFQPRRSVTRAEVIQVLDNLFDLYIDKPGTYNLAADQTALVTVPGVTLNTVKGRSDPNSHVYVMAPAFTGGGPTLTNADGGSVQLHGVSDQSPVWKTEGTAFLVKPQAVLILSDPQQVPHLSFASGSGTLADPYHIATGDQFLKAMALPTNRAGDGMQRMTYHLTLDNDVDLGVLTEALRSPMYFHLDGGGHTLTYQMKGRLSGPSEYHGLLNSLSSNCSVQDLTLAGTVDVSLADPTTDVLGRPLPKKLYVGGLAGVVHGQVTDCHTQLSITVHYSGVRLEDLYVGGLAGSLEECTMSGCTSQANLRVTAPQGETDCLVGGLVGEMCQASYYGIENQVAPGVYGTPAPETRKTVLRQCGSSATVHVVGGDHSMAGGLVGLLTSYISDSTITPEAYGAIEQCWSTANVSATGPSFQADCGGIVGQLAVGAIRQCWSAPTLQITTDSRYTFQNLGGISGSSVARPQLLIADCWTDVSGLTLPQGGGHYGGVTGRLEGEVTRCLVLGSDPFDPENALSYAAWTTTPPTASFALAGHTPQELADFLKTSGWDLETVWDSSGDYPVLRSLPAPPKA